jgi:hypothetical protein
MTSPAEILRLSLAAGGVQHDLGGDPLAAREMRDDRAVVAIHRGHLLTQPEHDSEVAEVVLEALGDLYVAEVEQARAFLDDGDLHPERSEHGRVLDADYPCAHDHTGSRETVEQQEAVGIEDHPVVELHRGRPSGARSGGDHDPLRAHAPVSVARDGDGVRVEETCAAADHVDVVSHQLVADDVDLALDHPIGP